MEKRSRIAEMESAWETHHPSHLEKRNVTKRNA